METMYVAGGCFWGLEELFRTQPGVVDTEVGYMGGKNNNPTYEFHPGHAESLRITFDPAQTSYRALLDFFFRVHDPTTLNRQGNDVGTSYRSAIFYETPLQKQQAEQVIRAVEASGLYKGKVTTVLEPYQAFWAAESYHQDYLQKHPGGYTCHYMRQAAPLLHEQ